MDKVSATLQMKQHLIDIETLFANLVRSHHMNAKVIIIITIISLVNIGWDKAGMAEQDYI